MTTTYSRKLCGKRIKAARERLCISQAEVAERVGVRVHSLYRWESGRSGPNASTLAALCTVLGVTSDHLLFGAR